MFASARWLSRVACAIALSACADSANPAAPRAEDPDAVPALSMGTAPTPEELAQMPASFQTAPSIRTAWTEVAFLPSDSRVFARGYVQYWATDAHQTVNVSLRFNNAQIASTEAVGEMSDWFPNLRSLSTSAYLGVSGACGHLADATTNHKVWHKFLFDEWKFLSWGTHGESSGNNAHQGACPQPPDDSNDDSDDSSEDEYDGGCESCQEWFYYFYGAIIDRWWECEPIADSYCVGAPQ